MKNNHARKWISLLTAILLVFLTAWIVHDQMRKNEASLEALASQNAEQSAASYALTDKDIQLLMNSLTDEQKERILQSVTLSDEDLLKVMNSLTDEQKAKILQELGVDMDAETLAGMFPYLKQEDYEGLGEYLQENLSDKDKEKLEQYAEALSREAEEKGEKEE